MSLLKLIGWGVATGMLAYMGFIISAFSGSGAVPTPERAAVWSALTALFAPIYVFVVPGAMLLALILHFTNLLAYAHWALIAAAVVSVVYPLLLVMVISR